MYKPEVRTQLREVEQQIRDNCEAFAAETQSGQPLSNYLQFDNQDLLVKRAELLKELIGWFEGPVQVYTEIDNKRIILDRPDGVIVNVGRNELSGVATYWSFMLDDFLSSVDVQDDRVIFTFNPTREGDTEVKVEVMI